MENLRRPTHSFLNPRENVVWIFIGRVIWGDSKEISYESSILFHHWFKREIVAIAGKVTGQETSDPVKRQYCQLSEQLSHPVSCEQG